MLKRRDPRIRRRGRNRRGLGLQPNLKLPGTRTSFNPQNLLTNIKANQFPAVSAAQVPAREIPAGDTDHPGQGDAGDQGVLGLDRLGIEGLDIPAREGIPVTEVPKMGPSQK